MPQNVSRKSEARLPKIIGSDTELGNVIFGDMNSPRYTGARAAQALLSEVEGVCSSASYRNFASYSTEIYYGGGYDFQGNTRGRGYVSNPQDVGRKYLQSNGGCCYIDLDHFEICTPETTSACDFTAAWHSMLRISQKALVDANAKLADGTRIVATANNSDGYGSSWGGHLSFLVHRKLFERLCVRPELLPFFYLLSFQVSSILYTGAGKVGAENRHAVVPYQIAQRADFFSTLRGVQTTHDRPLVNTRNEALCGASHGADNVMSRLHVIFYDTTLAPVSTYLKAGVMQIVLAMLEAKEVDARHHLASPLRALHCWSQDPDLNARALLSNGQRVTAVEHQLLILEDVKAFVMTGEADEYVPDATRIIALWEDTLLKLQQRDWSALSGRLDWVAKRLLIDNAVQRSGIGWDSAEARHLDLLFANLDPGLGLHWVLARDGLIEQVNTLEQVENFIHSPPEDTRAWSRAMLLRLIDEESIDQVDWDRIRVRLSGSNSWPTSFTVPLDNPFAHTRADTESIFSTNPDFPALVTALGGFESGWSSHLNSWAAAVTSPGATND